MSALLMDPDSYNCTSDAMMRQFCEDPLGSSFWWTLLAASLFGLPFFGVWIALGLVLIAKSEATRTKK